MAPVTVGIQQVKRYTAVAVHVNRVSPDPDHILHAQGHAPVNRDHNSWKRSVSAGPPVGLGGRQADVVQVVGQLAGLAPRRSLTIRSLPDPNDAMSMAGGSTARFCGTAICRRPEACPVPTLRTCTATSACPLRSAPRSALLREATNSAAPHSARADRPPAVEPWRLASRPGPLVNDGLALPAGAGRVPVEYHGAAALGRQHFERRAPCAVPPSVSVR